MSRFHIISKIGEGGFGEAFRAWDSVESVPVVLKMPLREHLGRKSVLERFGREINRLLTIVHPHVVPIVDHGVWEDGRPFFAMRFLPGGSLEDRKQKLALGYLHSWLPGVAAALDYAHQLGVIHRDIKPANIFLDTQSEPYIGDFGIAKVIDDYEVKEDTLTKTGAAVGTSPYMAPEFYRKPRVLTGAYDQYALAITVFEIVAGERPFSGDSGQLIVAHQLEDPPDISDKVSNVPQSLAVAVARALSKKPEDRFSTCSEFSAAVLRDLGVITELEHRFLCPSCNKVVAVSRDFAGRGGRCPKCKSKLRVAENFDALWLREEDPQKPFEKMQVSRSSESRKGRINTLMQEDGPLTETETQGISEENPSISASNSIKSLGERPLILVICFLVLICAVVVGRGFFRKSESSHDTKDHKLNRASEGMLLGVRKEDLRELERKKRATMTLEERRLQTAAEEKRLHIELRKALGE